MTARSASIPAAISNAGAEHEDHEVERRLAFQAGHEMPPAHLVALHRILPDRGAAVEALLDDVVARAE
jgi:hypothetical protein